MGHPPQTSYAFGPFRLEIAERRLLRNGAPVPLALKAFEVLLALVENRGRLLLKEDLLKRVWPDTFVEEANLAVAVSQIRKSLGDVQGGEHRYIETVRSIGYRFIVDVEEIDSAPEVRTTRAPITTIAVLPLENLSPDPAQEYFVDGMTDELITKLARIKSLKVISRTSVMRYKDIRKRLPDIAAELGADAVVEGSVLRAGERVRINAQLIHASTDAHLWAASYEGELSDVLGLHSAVSRAIAREVHATLSTSEYQRLVSSASVNPQAYELYLKGRHFGNRRTTEGFTKAIELFDESIRLDQDFALPYAGLAEVYAVWYYSPVPIAERFVKARDAAMRALKLDDSLAEAHAVRAYLMHRFEWDWVGAEAEFQRALELNPGYAAAHQWYALFLISMGRFEEAIGEGRLVCSLDPLSSAALAALGRVFYFAHRLPEAIEQFRNALELNPNFSSVHMDLARGYALAGQSREAIQQAQLVLTKSGPNGSLLAELGYVYAKAGMRAEALTLLADIEKRLPSEHIAPAPMAYMFVALEDLDRAVDWFEIECRERGNFLPFINTDPWLEPLRSHPRFQRLLASLRFPAPSIQVNIK
jgi:TolB-like protein/Flp pilus assembly protein TadD